MDDRLYWDRYAWTYDDGVDYVVGKALRQAVAKRLSQERELGEVLECGCGTGFFTKEIAGSSRSIRATDVSTRMLEAARRRLAVFPHIALERADAEGTAFVPESFDTVLLANVLNTVPDPAGVLGECRRLLRAGGALLVIVYTDHGMVGRQKTDLQLRYFQKFGMPPSWGLKNFAPDELKETLRHAGFSVRTLSVIGEDLKALYARSRKVAASSQIGERR